MLMVVRGIAFQKQLQSQVGGWDLACIGLSCLEEQQETEARQRTSGGGLGGGLTSRRILEIKEALMIVSHRV